MDAFEILSDPPHVRRVWRWLPCVKGVIVLQRWQDVSLISDLPLFVDPFLLFNSDKPQYRQLHDQIIEYVRQQLQIGVVEAD